MISKLSTTWCQVNDMSRSIAFYKDALGLQSIMESPHWTMFRVGDQAIALHHRLEPGEGPLGENGKGWYLGLQTDNLAPFRQSVVENGGTAFGYHEVPGGVVLTVCDPDGNPIQIMQPNATIGELG